MLQEKDLNLRKEQKKKLNNMKELVVRTLTDSKKEVYKGFQFTVICFVFF